MSEKYAVPALERANAVLSLLAQEPYTWTLSELSRHLNISKSTMYSLLLTMERLHWVNRDRHDTYALGSAIGKLVSAYAGQYDLIEEFRRLAQPVMRKLQETVQLARLEETDVLYLAKMEAPSPVQMVAGPGVRFPAHATGLGKSLLACLQDEQVCRLFPSDKLKAVTSHTLDSREALLLELARIRKNGYALDLQEGVMGFCCAAAPIRRANGEAVAAVSCSMPIHQWEAKKADAIEAITDLAKRLTPIL
ncbi:IclR family transcriptional regulator [Xylanibacillus composti]|uniref:IclR family transcriptional regulator n=1 Tax=Xylanibacillus composti TaxID=1572762 RepID=A0A8J4H526_9BACL|nr:IclR family transcriptional regulator [Xylanibacillus composti]MDT9724528.1 IclR family transcriptional regulator [Xylanibacillus composti]GIQ69791.1 IclR family transcriptional regulator [Xylanibacillus composti]